MTSRPVLLPLTVQYCTVRGAAIPPSEPPTLPPASVHPLPRMASASMAAGITVDASPACHNAMVSQGGVTSQASAAAARPKLWPGEPKWRYSQHIAPLALHAVYPSWEAYKMALWRHLVATKASARFPDSRGRHHATDCKHKANGCPFRVFASVNEEFKPEVRVFNDSHTCALLPKSGRDLTHDSRWLRWAMLDIVIAEPGIVITTMQRGLGLRLTRTVWASFPSRKMMHLAR
jgi:hypothetical protein